MINRRIGSSAAIGLALFVAASGAAAADRSAKVKKLGERREAEALVYFIREPRISNKTMTLLIYAGESFLGVVENDSYTFAYVPPGRQLLWLNWSSVSREVQLEAGEVYYFDLTFSEGENFRHFAPLEEEAALALLDQVKFYTTPTDKERETSRRHIANRFDDAHRQQERFVPDSDGAITAAGEKHIGDWPSADLATYHVLYLEPFSMLDPKASKRKPRELIDAAAQYLVDQIASDLGNDVFETVFRKAPAGPAPGSVILRGRITKYVPGSPQDTSTGIDPDEPDGWSVAFVPSGQPQLDFEAVLIDGSTGVELALRRIEEEMGRARPQRLWGDGPAT